MNKFLDNIDVYEQYDLSMFDLFHFPYEGRDYKRKLLLLKSVDELISLALENNIPIENFTVEDNDTHKNLLSMMIVNSGRVPVIIATPSIEFGKSFLQDGRKPPYYPYEHFRFPVVTIQRITVADDYTRWSSVPFRKLAWTNNQNEVLSSEPLIPKLVTYQIEIYATLRKQMNYLDMSVSRLFTPTESTFAMINLGSPWGERKGWIDVEDEFSDDSVYEGAGLEEQTRLLRHVYTAKLRTWLPSYSSLTKTVRKVQFDYVDRRYDGEEELLLSRTYDESDFE